MPATGNRVAVYPGPSGEGVSPARGRRTPVAPNTREVTMISPLGQLLREQKYGKDLETEKVEKQNTFSPSQEERKVLCPLRA